MGRPEALNILARTSAGDANELPRCGVPVSERGEVSQPAETFFTHGGLAILTHEHDAL